jgi:hypothetical protein
MGAMELRQHPLMRYLGLSSWPPAWTWIGGKHDEFVSGELGMLREVRLNDSGRLAKCYLIIDYNQNLYMGCEFFRDKAFALQLFQLLESQRGRPIEEIGGLDVSHLL